MICFLSCGCLFPCLGYTQDNQSQSNLWGIIMKHNNALLHGCLLAAGLTLLPFAAHATGLSNHFLAENSFTQSVKDGYQDIRYPEVPGTPGQGSEEVSEGSPRRPEGLREETRKGPARIPEAPQAAPLPGRPAKGARKRPRAHDREVTPMPRPSGAFLYLPPKARPDKTGRSVCPGPFSIQRTPA